MARFLLVFDLDGTLVDTVPDLAAALNEMLRERARAPLSTAQVRRMVGDGVAALVARALAARDLEPEELAHALPRFLELYEANVARLSRPYEGVRETLAALRRRGYATAVATNKPQRASEKLLEELRLAALFDAVAGGDRFPVRKPDPGHLLGLIALIGGSVLRAAMIGDNENDLKAARAAHLPVVLMGYGYARSAPQSLGADALLDEFSQLPAALQRLGLVP
jgi:phosphoglycolate phosphatase